MKRENTKIFFILSFLFAVLLVVAPWLSESLMARPGGGQSYSGGSSGSGSGGGDGIVELIFWIILQLPPEISIPLVIIILVVRFLMKRSQKRAAQKISSTPTFTNVSQHLKQVDNILEAIPNYDPNFSRVVFVDFISALYHKLYNTLGTKELSNIFPFFSEQEVLKLKSPEFQDRKYTEIVIGNIQISDVKFTNTYLFITLDIDSNYTLNHKDRSTRYILTERWLLMRGIQVVSPEPEKMRTISCPSCGAAANFNDAGRCNYCNTFIHVGQMQWMVKMRSIIKQETMKTIQAGTYTEEVGTGSPTLVQAGLQKNKTIFAQRNNLDWNSYWEYFSKNVVTTYLLNIFQSWSVNKLFEVRHLLSDRLFESYNFWQTLYKEQKLINRLENINVRRVELVKIESDKFYETITVRVFVSGLDYIENKEGKLIGGSKKKNREFSEYWTFMRRSGKELKEETLNLKNCPNCGAPADNMGQAAECGYCGAKISNGDFSWVLTAIAQDEAYRG